MTGGSNMVLCKTIHLVLGKRNLNIWPQRTIILHMTLFFCDAAR